MILKGVLYQKFSNLVKKIFLSYNATKFGIDNKTFNMFFKAFDGI